MSLNCKAKSPPQNYQTHRAPVVRLVCISMIWVCVSPKTAVGQLYNYENLTTAHDVVKSIQLLCSVIGYIDVLRDDGGGWEQIQPVRRVRRHRPQSAAQEKRKWHEIQSTSEKFSKVSICTLTSGRLLVFYVDDGVCALAWQLEACGLSWNEWGFVCVCH